MKLSEYLNSPLLPRVEKIPDIYASKPYYALPDDISIYSAGFNKAYGSNQGQLLIQNLNDMDTEKYDNLEKYMNCEIDQVVTFPDADKTHIHIHIKLK